MQSDFDLSGKRIWVAGHRGMVGAALVRRLSDEACEILTIGRDRLDLRNQAATENWLQAARPDAVIVAAATVGGIQANNDRPVDFLYDNLMIEANIINASWKAGVDKLLFLGSSCIYPRLAPQPIQEDALLTGALEPTNEWYAIAKIAGIKLCQAYRKQYGCNFISAMPTNLYGPGDNFDLQSSHVLPALLRKAHAAKQTASEQMTIWGSGTPLREFLHVDDLADALVFLLQFYADEKHVNVGSHQEYSIRALAELICKVVGFDGDLVFDKSKPDGTPRKLMDSSILKNLGWTPKIPFESGLRQTYAWFCANQPSLRGITQA